MSISTLATVKVPAHSGNYTANRSSIKWNDKTQQISSNGTPSSITMVTIHHMAGVNTAEGCGQIFAKAGRGGSSHYGIGNDGTIGNYVDEKDVAWTNSNYYSNCHAVTIETSNSSTGGNWPVSDAALKSLIKLVADIAKRNNLGKLVPGQNLTWHKMYAATGCPGEYLLSKMQYIADEANKINSSSTQPSNNGKKTPAQIAAEWPNNRHVIDGTNITRLAQKLICYKEPQKITGTNQWGVEILVDKNGVMISKPEASGNHSIPTGGKVISGHDTAGTWIKKNCAEGYLCWISNDVLYVDKKQHRTINALNGTRWTNYLCVYNKANTTTGTNKWGYEVQIDKNGYALANPTAINN